MATYIGSSLVLSWVTTSATTALSGDSRTFTVNENLDTVDATAGADTIKQWLAGPTDRTASLSYLHQGGITDISLLQPGQVGTLLVYPEGTTTTKPLYTYPLLISSLAKSIPYNNVVQIDVGFMSYGAGSIGTA